jgi:outer membrane protein, adhesin transport system
MPSDVKAVRPRLALLAVAGVFIAGGVSAGPLEDAVAAALLSNPEVVAAASNRLATDETIKQARAGYFPSVDFRGASGVENSNNPSTRQRVGRINGEESNLTFWRNEAGLTLRQMLFDGFATSSQVDQNLARTESAAARVRRTSESVGLDAVEAYLQVQRRAELVQIAESNIAAHERYLGLVRRRAQQGGGTTADVRQAESRLALARENLAASQGQLDTARATYKRVIGAEASNTVRPEVPEARLPSSVNEAVSRGIIASPQVQAAEADIEAAQAALSGTDAPFYPRLDAELAANKNKNIDGVRGLNDDYTAQLVLRYNLYRGGGDIARRSEAGYRLNEAKARLDVAQRQVEEDLRSAWAAMVSARGQVRALQDQVAANQQVTQLYQRQFDLNQRTFLDLLDAENALFGSRGNQVSAEIVAMFAVYRVLATGGMLVDALGLQGPAEGRSARQR